MLHLDGGWSEDLLEQEGCPSTDSHIMAEEHASAAPPGFSLLVAVGVEIKHRYVLVWVSYIIALFLASLAPFTFILPTYS